jgi:hypothetical protein
MDKKLLIILAVVFVAVAGAVAFNFISLPGPAQIGRTPKPSPTPTPDPFNLIMVTGAGFMPDSMSVAPNTEVMFLNQAGRTIEIKTNDADHPDLNTGQIRQGMSKTVKFTSPGLYTLYLSSAPTVKGQILVQ